MTNVPEIGKGPQGPESLPQEITQYPCFAVSGASKAPMGIGANGKLRLISVHEPSARMTFANALAVRNANRDLVTYATKKDGTVEQRTGLDIGLILSELDPFTVIDLDVKDATTHPHNPELWTTPEDFRAATKIYEKFDSFTEWSRSGKGLHVWVRGDIGAGFRKGCIEIYTRDRYMICTGKVFLDRPIVHNQPLLDALVSEMRPLPTFTKLVEEPEEDGDWYILQMGLNAANADKFRNLYDGKWVGYDSQSEADLALMSMLAFYSRSNEQCRRMFRKSGLGRRDKAIKNNVYLDRTLTLIRSGQAERKASSDKVDISGLLSRFNGGSSHDKA
jgi:hypothetical protein